MNEEVRGELTPFKPQPQQRINVFAQLSNATECIRSMAQWIKDAGMFECKTTGQAYLLAYSVIANGSDLIELNRQYHIANGQFTLKAREMANRFIRSGGTIRQIVRTPDLAQLELRRGTEKATFSFSWQEARIEDYVFIRDANKGMVAKVLADGSVNPAALKENWSTPRRRMQMLWARCITDAIGSFASDVTAGYYAPEELESGYLDSEEGDIVDAEFNVVDEPPIVQPTASAPATAPPQAASPSVDQQEASRQKLIMEAAELKKKIGIEAEQWKQLLAHFGVTSGTQLTLEQVDQLVADLKVRWEQQKTEADQAGFLRP